MGRTAAKAAERKRKGSGPAKEPLVSRFAATHGDFRHEHMAVTAGELPQTPAGNVTVLRNRGGTAVERWRARGDLTLEQTEAIALYARAHRLHIGEQRVVANWSMVASLRGGAADFDQFVGTRLAAKNLLKLLDDEVFFRFPLHYQEVWQNVVLHDEAAGVVGARLGYKNDRAEAAAKATVLLIADQIAVVMRLGRRPASARAA